MNKYPKSISYSLFERPVPNWFWLGLALLFSFGLNGYMILFKGIHRPDLIPHIEMSEGFVKGERVLIHPGFFLLIQIFSFFTFQRKLEIFAGFLIFSLAQVWKIYESGKLFESISGKRLSLLYFVLVLALQFAFPFKTGGNFAIMGRISPTYFHNGTLSLCFPLAILLFRKAMEFLETRKDLSVRTFLYGGFFLILIKPSFVFAFIPLFPFLTLVYFGLSRELLDSLKVAVFLTFCIILQSMILRVYPDDFYRSFKVVFHPFFLYGSILSHLRIAFEGVLMGWIFCLLFARQIMRSPTALLAIGLVVGGYAISFLFYDVREGIAYPDLTWQSSIYGYLFLLVAPALSLKFCEGLRTFRFWILAILGGGHALFGLYYVLYCSRLGIYYFY